MSSTYLKNISQIGSFPKKGILKKKTLFQTTTQLGYVRVTIILRPRSYQESGGPYRFIIDITEAQPLGGSKGMYFLVHFCCFLSWLFRNKFFILLWAPAVGYRFEVSMLHQKTSKDNKRNPRDPPLTSEIWVKSVHQHDVGVEPKIEVVLPFYPPNHPCLIGF